MGTARGQYTDEFKQEAVGLLASSGRPVSQIAEELGIASSRLRAWRNKGDGTCGIAAAPQYAVIPHAGADLAAETARAGSAEMKFRLLAAQREMFPVRVLCDVIGVSPAGYYAWRGGPNARARQPIASCWPRSSGFMRRIAGAMACQGSMRPCAPEGTRRAVAVSNASCVIKTSGRQCRGRFASAPPICQSPPTGLTKNSPPRGQIRFAR
jgi:transposase